MKVIFYIILNISLYITLAIFEILKFLWDFKFINYEDSNYFWKGFYLANTASYNSSEYKGKELYDNPWKALLRIK